MNQIPESDWKTWRKISPVALERFCSESLEGVRGITLRAGSAHARYRDLFAFLRKRDDLLVAIFDGQRRSNAYFQMARAIAENVLLPDEIDRLSPETLARVRLIAGIEAEA